MRPDGFPLSYDECRERFRWTSHVAGLSWQALTGAHGDEGFSSSTLSCDAIGRWVSDGADPDLPDDAAVLMVHAVNPWGMTFWRRQNDRTST